MLILNIPVKHQQCQVDQMYAIYEIMKARTLYNIKLRILEQQETTSQNRSLVTLKLFLD